jgi:hypothetical protein
MQVRDSSVVRRGKVAASKFAGARHVPHSVDALAARV